MATETLTTSEQFPVGTSVAAFPRDAMMPGRAPSGTATTTATVAAGGTLTFSGLTAETRYTAYALVGSEHRYVGFTTLTRDSEPDDRSRIGELEADVLSVESDGGPAKLGTTNTFTAKQTGTAGADWLGADVRLGRTPNVITPDFLYDFNNEKLITRALKLGDVGDSTDLILQRAGPDDIAEPHGAHTGVALPLLANVNLGVIYGQAWGGDASTLTSNHTFPVGTVNVASATLFPASGTAVCSGAAGLIIHFSYTGKSGTTLTGCTGGTGVGVSGQPCSPTVALNGAIVNGDWDGTAAGQNKAAGIYFRTSELQTATARGQYIDFQTTASGTDVSALALRLAHDGKLMLGANADVNLYAYQADVGATDDQFLALGGVATKVKSGIPTDADVARAQTGTLILDDTNFRLYVRSGGVWKYAALT